MADGRPRSPVIEDVILQLGDKEGVRFTRENGAVTHGGNRSSNEADGGGARAQNPVRQRFSGAGVVRDAKRGDQGCHTGVRIGEGKMWHGKMRQRR
jgi:hypothetical protein